MLWDGYIHINGNLHVKLLFRGESSIEKDSPFVEQYLQPIEADNREDAISKLIKENNLIETNGKV